MGNGSNTYHQVALINEPLSRPLLYFNNHDGCCEFLYDYSRSCQCGGVQEDMLTVMLQTIASDGVEMYVLT